MSEDNLTIVEKHCTGCGLCARACPFGAISLSEQRAVIDYEKCTLCGACASVCKVPGAIEFEASPGQSATGRGDVWVYCELCNNVPAKVSFELLGRGRVLADRLGVRVTAVVLAADNIDSHANHFIASGADRVVTVEDAAFATYRDEPFAAVLASLIEKHEPEILLGGATAIGRALLPRVAVLVNTGLTADCTGLEIDSETGLLNQTRPAFGGNIMATITCRERRPQMATVRPGVFPLPLPDSLRKGEIIQEEALPHLVKSSLNWLDEIPTDRGGEDIREAEIIVTAGKGAGGPEGVKLVARLADALGGSLGASRAAVDAGWVSYPHQVGQTGATVQPSIYIACGVSGAIQHLVGMQNSDFIIAVNRDPEAPIFDYADLAVVGDIQEVLPTLIRRIEEKRRLARLLHEK